MKAISKSIGVTIVLIGLLVFPGCKNNDKEEPVPFTQTQLEKLAQGWKIKSVKLDGIDQTDYYADFSVSVSGTNPISFNYTTSGRPAYSCWPEAGSFAFGQIPATTVIRDKGTDKELSIAYQLTDTSLELTFLYEGELYTSERVNTVSGEWTFVFER